jgi:hypothetical protein
MPGSITARVSDQKENSAVFAGRWREVFAELKARSAVSET